jgi:hypothetical protein
MTEESTHESAADAMRRINQAWLHGRLDDLAPMIHPEIVMVLPGFAGRIQGRDAFLAGFLDFLENARVHEYQDDDPHISVADDVAVATFRYVMIYERAGQRSRATGRELWVLSRRDGHWVAVWRAMLEIDEAPAT